MNISFENQVALVTGAAAGMGLATAKAFAASGASVTLKESTMNMRRHDSRRPFTTAISTLLLTPRCSARRSRKGA
jgi:NADP-dependent 3-hydroxy acid dehydrogenase YdfG